MDLFSFFVGAIVVVSLWGLKWLVVEMHEFFKFITECPPPDYENQCKTCYGRGIVMGVGIPVVTCPTCLGSGRKNEQSEQVNE